LPADQGQRLLQGTSPAVFLESFCCVFGAYYFIDAVGSLQTGED
jgi:hypothetical protein